MDRRAKRESSGGILPVRSLLCRESDLILSRSFPSSEGIKDVSLLSDKSSIPVRPRKSPYTDGILPVNEFEDKERLLRCRSEVRCVGKVPVKRLFEARMHRSEFSLMNTTDNESFPTYHPEYPVSAIQIVHSGGWLSHSKKI